MTFQAYIDAVKTKTGKTPEQLKSKVAKAGVFSLDMKVAVLMMSLAEQYDLGRGHAMSVWAVWKSKGWVQAPK